MVEFFIDGQRVRANSGDTILQAARANGIYIPTMCYLSKVSSIESCRICVVEVEGNDGFVLSCSTPVVSGIKVHTNSSELFKHRQSIMKMYNVNHPLQCGVCDKSGECDLQNKTAEFRLEDQEFSTKDISREVQDWGFIQYDPSLCIVCEKCVSTCNEIVGDANLKVKVGGYSSQIEFVGDSCSNCGECMAVCPVGALSAKDFKYSANAWELEKVPAVCGHCSSGCELFYERKHTQTLADNAPKIYRVTNDFEYKSLCGLGRFGYDISNEGIKDDKSLEKAVAKIKEYGAIRFNSVITNEEALILQELKRSCGIKLYNEEARAYATFLDSFATSAGQSLYSGDLEGVKQSDFVVVFGSKIADENPVLKYAINQASKTKRAKVTYLHPIDDPSLQNIVTQAIRYEVATEEGVMALLCHTLLGNDLEQPLQQFLDDLDIGNLSAESNVGEEELELIAKNLQRKEKKSFIVGSDLYQHPRAKNIATMLGLLQKYADFDVTIIPPAINSLGVSLICELDVDSGDEAVGYNSDGEFVMGVDGELMLPAFLQQEGTVTTIDKMVKPTNAGLDFNGYTLKDVANALGMDLEYTIDMTCKLPKDRGFKQIEFDAMMAQFDPYDGKDSGYALQPFQIEQDYSLEAVDELPEFNGVVVYNSNRAMHANSLSVKSENLSGSNYLYGSKQFTLAAKIEDGDRINFSIGDRDFSKVFKIDTNLKGVIAINPTFGDGLSGDMLSSVYKFSRVNIKIESGNDE